LLNSEQVISGLSKQAKDKDYRFDRIYRNFYIPDMYIKAYANIYSNKGSSTKGTDGTTADRFSEERIQKLIDSLKDESYQPGAVRRTYIPKKNGKLRPLGIPNFDDRLVQEVCRMVLEAIYEPIMLESSHGFRPNRSCHTALAQIQNQFKGVNWFIEGDIKGFFDNIDHHVLIGLLRKRIVDEKFIRLIWKFLKAGYMADWKYNNTYSGTPQGGIVSPILANIYLHELDVFVEDTLKREFKFGDRVSNKIVNPAYSRITGKMQRMSKKISTLEREDPQRQSLITSYNELKKQRQTENYTLGLGDYKNLFYVRYADDFIIGVHGSKNDCQQIKAKLSDFLQKALKLELTEEKTLITNSADGAVFLNYGITIEANDKFFTKFNGVKSRAGNRSTIFRMPKEVMKNYVISKGLAEDINAKKWRGVARNYLLNRSDLEILSTYNAEIRGLYTYYALASNVSRNCQYMCYLMEYSCLKTLAGKYKTTVRQVRAKLQIGKDWGVRYDTKTEKGKIRLFYNEGFAMRKAPYPDTNVDELPKLMVYAGTTELEQRISAKKCEMCGKENVEFHIHHVHAVKDLKGKDEWERLMIAKRRKTLVLCKECHAERTKQQMASRKDS